MTNVTEMVKRPTCCKAATDCEGIDWNEANCWGYAFRDAPPGLGMVLGWERGDTGKSDEPQYGPIAFCPFCGAKGLAMNYSNVGAPMTVEASLKKLDALAEGWRAQAGTPLNLRPHPPEPMPPVPGETFEESIVRVFAPYGIMPPPGSVEKLRSVWNRRWVTVSDGEGGETMVPMNEAWHQIGVAKNEIVADGSTMRGLADGSIKIGLGCGPLIPKRAIEVVPAPGDRCGGTGRLDGAGARCPGCRACS